MRILSLAFVLPLLLAGFAAADEPATIDNPEFAHWSKFKVGTWVKLESEQTGGGQTMKTTMTHKVVELTKEKAVIETTMSFGMPGMEPQTTKRDVPAKMPKPPEVPKTDESLKPEVKEGEETIEVVGKKIKCKTTEMTMDIGQTKSWTKSWTSEDVPGFLVKMEQKTTGAAESSSKTTLKEWKSE